MSELDDIFATLGVRRATDDPIADAVSAVADGHLRRAQREAAARLAEKANADRLDALRRRAEAGPRGLTIAEAAELDRADRFAARDASEAAGRAASDHDARLRLAGGKGSAEAQYRDAYTDWLAGNGAGHGVPAPKREDFIDV
ncbi:hypothetical protein ACPPVO_08190 [Dactylosporangium sp. McL0621]|uniref:hypothetical protein n=1 Tax=Dactylosporangium sp. McL0621 TaxID=3415678 RepID=UPI003CEF88C1